MAAANAPTDDAGATSAMKGGKGGKKEKKSSRQQQQGEQREQGQGGRGGAATAANKWWRSSDEADPISLEPIRELPHPPFELSIDGSTVSEQQSRERQLRISSSGGSHGRNGVVVVVVVVVVMVKPGGRARSSMGGSWRYTSWRRACSRTP